MKKSFHSFIIERKVEDKKLPILLICNHISWWDGLWTLHINQQLYHRKYHFMMLEEQLQKNWFFKYTGGFSIRKNSKSLIDSLNYTAELLVNNKNMVLIFPQGEIGSMHDTNFVFEKGISKILQRTKNEIQTIFVANFVDYHSNAKPTLHAYMHNYSGSFETAEIQKSYNSFYKDCVSNQIKMKG
jgi:1-acyl-sn-glycerol-3-phosphate acyltransferase